MARGPAGLRGDRNQQFRRNLPGGGFAHRMARKITNELGIPLKQQPSNAEHVVLDVEHAHLLMRAARLHATTEQNFALIPHGAAESLLVERTFKGVLGGAMAALSDPA